MTEIIRFENVTKYYDNKKEPVIDNLNFSIKKGEFITVMGASGCGKTTMLRLINGLIKPDKGNIYIKGKELKDWNLIELRRNIGYIIQHVGLFPHMSIAENISYVLEIKKTDKNIKRTKAIELIKLVGLSENYLNKYPAELSGGEKQRIGVARALAANPDIILMDEPLGAVEDVTRKNLQDEILKIYKSLNKTIVFVTHDIEEAFKLGNKIILFNKGQMLQSGTKEEMIFSPKNEFVKNFLGSKSFSAFLNTTEIKAIMQPINGITLNIKNEALFPIIKENASIMESIKVMFENGVDKVFIKDESGNLCGEFMFANLMKIQSINESVSSCTHID